MTRQSNDHPERAENVGAGLGIVAGAVAGTIGGPIGMIVGASVGSVAGEAVGRAVHRHAEAKAKHERELDDAISLTPGPGAIVNEADLDFAEPVKAATFLRADHDELEALAARLVQGVVEGDRQDVGVVIALMQARVIEHLDGEERNLLEGYAQYAPDDAREILREHAEIRKTLAEFDVGVDLHLVRADAVKAFLTALQAHSARENAGLYRWAATAPAPTTA